MVQISIMFVVKNYLLSYNEADNVCLRIKSQYSMNNKFYALNSKYILIHNEISKNTLIIRILVHDNCCSKY